jgi:hypothetical protein
MKARIFLVALCVAILAGAFVYLSSSGLPPVVASHFVAGGAANGFMPRGTYVGLMVALASGFSLLLPVLVSMVDSVPLERFNLPNRDYWLAEERRADTLAFLHWHGAFLGVLIAAFLCFVHWLVLRANAVQPPLFPERTLITALPLFLLVMAVWIGALFLRFRRPG